MPAGDGLLVRGRHDVSIGTLCVVASCAGLMGAVHSDGPGAFDFIQGDNSSQSQ